MASLNKVFLMGNLTRDPEVRQAGSSNVCRLGLATNRRYTTSAGEEREEVCFVDVEVWGRQAESCGQYLRKGSPALVEGRLHLDQWEDRQSGQRRSKLMVRAERVQFLGAPRGGSGQQAEYGAGGGYQQQGGGYQQPQQGGYGQPQQAQQPAYAPPPQQAFAPPAAPSQAPVQPPQAPVQPPAPQQGGQAEDDIPF